MGEPFLWVHANPRQECLGRFTQLFDTEGGAWGPGTVGGTFRLFCRRMEIGELPSIRVTGCWRRLSFRLCVEELAKPLNRCRLFGALLHAILLSFLDSGKVLGCERPEYERSSFRDGDVSALGDKISYGCPRYCLARWTSSPEESRKVLHGQVTRIFESP